MKCEIKGCHIRATTKYDIPLISNHLRAEDILEKQLKDEYIDSGLTNSSNVNLSEDENDICGICQISFNHHCNHCSIKLSLPYKNDVNVHHRRAEDESGLESPNKELFKRKEKLCPLSNGVCNHFFHLHCIERWLDQGTSGNKCPMCRQNYFSSDSNDESLDNDEEMMD